MKGIKRRIVFLLPLVDFLFHPLLEQTTYLISPAKQEWASIRGFRLAFNQKGREHILTVLDERP